MSEEVSSAIQASHQHEMAVAQLILASEARVLARLDASDQKTEARIDRMDTRINGRIRSLESFRSEVSQRHVAEDATRRRDRLFITTVASIAATVMTVGLAAAGLLHSG